SKDSEVDLIKEEIKKVNAINLKLEKKLQEESDFCLSIELFVRTVQEASRECHGFSKLLIGLMKDANWDLDSAANSIQPDMSELEAGAILFNNRLFNPGFLLYQQEQQAHPDSQGLSRLSEKPLDLRFPRFMAPTTSSRLQGRSYDSKCISPGKEIKREKMNGRGETLSTHVRTMVSCSKPSDIAQSQNETKHRESDDRMLRQSSMTSTKVVARFGPKQCTIDESRCLSEGSMVTGDNHRLRCSSIPNNKRVCAGSLSKQLCKSDE
ncbi:hypothetical protein KI387_033830, partial [Taxus chinensis]